VDMEVEAVPGLKMRGTIERIAPQSTIRNGIKGFATRILLNQIDPRVRPGMTANLTIPISTAENVVTVPLAAVFTDMGERYIWVVKDGGDNGAQYERRSVSIGVADFSMVEIQSGLKAGERVALESPPAKVVEALGLGNDKKTTAGSGLGPISNRPPAASVGAGSVAMKTNVLAAATNRLAAPVAKP
jgi:multidrug efflux pump subunit AcrA (membrane-fusion protein)